MPSPSYPTSGQAYHGVAPAAGWAAPTRPPTVLISLIERIARTCREKQLFARVGRESEYLVELTAYGTTLAMNYLTRGKFVHK